CPCFCSCAWLLRMRRPLRGLQTRRAPHIHVRRPPGLRTREMAVGSSEAEKPPTTNHQPSVGGTMKQVRRAGRTLLLCAAFVLSLACTLPAFAQDIETRLDQLMVEYDTVGLAVVVVRDNAVVYQKA